MSFSVEERHSEIDKTGNIQMNDGHYSYQFFEMLNKIGISIKSSITDTAREFEIDMDDFSFSVKSLNDKIVIDYKVVTTSGPILGFLGYYIDLESGYILLNMEKSREYIPLINFYSLLEGSIGTSVNKELMTALIERFKMGDVGVESFEQEFKENAMSFDDKSILSRLINGQGKRNSVEDFTFFDNIFHIFRDLAITMSQGFIRDNSADKVKFAVYNILNKVTEGDSALDFIRALNMNIVASREIGGIHNGIRPEMQMNSVAGQDLKSSTIGLLLSTSSMVNQGVSYGKYHTNAYQMNDMAKSDILALNLRDIVEEYDDNRALLDMDTVIYDGQASTEEVHAVIEKIGVDEYFEGRELGAVTRALKSRKDVGDYLTKTTADISMTDDMLDIDILSYSDVGHSFKRSVVFYKNALKLMDKIFR